MSTHIKDKDPDTWAEIIRICEQYSGTNASELRREICAIKNVTRQTVHNWIKQQDIPFADRPRVEREVVFRGIRHLSERDPESWASVLRIFQECANKGMSPNAAFSHLQGFGFSKASLFGWIKDGLIPAYTYTDAQGYKACSRYL